MDFYLEQAVDVLLASSDTGQSAEEVVRYYRQRYQLELRIRDGKHPPVFTTARRGVRKRSMSTSI